MISLEPKETEPARWKDHIVPALTAVYGSASGFASQIEAFDGLREAATATPRDLNRGAKRLYRYYAQMELLGFHIPMSPFRTEFTWHGIYDDDVVTQTSLAFEKACILYNLAAQLSVEAADEARAHEFKPAYHKFCCAAGILDFVAQKFLHAASIDLQPSTLAVVSRLMLAQAQECFVHKAAESKTPPGLRAKLGKAAADLYNDASTGLKELFDEDYWGDKANIKEIDTRIREVMAQAHEDQAAHKESTRNVGEAVAHLREAIELSSDKRHAKDLAAKAKALERDNDLIYHDRIPAQVPALQAAQTAKPVQLESLYTTEEASKIVGKDIFEDAVPVAVHEKASLYSELKARFLRDAQEKAEIADLELTSALEYMDLPASIVRLREPPSTLAEVPPEVLEWSAEINTAGPVNTDVESVRQRIINALKAPNASVDSVAVKQKLVTATKSDAELRKMHDAVKADVALMRDTQGLHSVYKNEVAKALAGAPPDISLLDLDAPDTGTDDLSPSLNEVSNAVAKLHRIMAERKNIIAELREKVHADDITSVLVANQFSENLEDGVLKPEMQKFDPLVKRLDATVRLQSSVLSDTASKWKAILNSPAAKKVVADREKAAAAVNALTNRFRGAFTNWQAVCDGAELASSFYSQLEREATTRGGPPVPPKPPKPPGRANDLSLSGYRVPSAYNPSMYQ